jgi:hypothetical protein
VRVTLKGALHNTSKLWKKSNVMPSTYYLTNHGNYYLSFVVSEEIRGLSVEWVVWVWFVEQVDQTVDDGIDVKYGLPVLTQNVQTDVTLQIDIWVVDFRLACNFWRFMRI